MNAAIEERALIFGCGTERLVGVMHVPVAPVHGVPAVLVVVGGPQYRVGSHRQFVQTARALARAGYTVLRFDYRGMGDSEGEQRTFESVEDDVRAAADALLASAPQARGVVIYGLCDAASAALMYVPSDERVQGLVLLNPWARSVAGESQAILKKYYGSRLLQAEFWAKVVRLQFDVLGSVRSLFAHVRGATARGDAAAAPGFIARMHAGARAFRGPVLLIESGRDLTAEEFRTLRTGDAAWRRAIERPGVEIESLPQADHTFSDAAQLAAADARCVAWLQARFAGADTEAAACR